jgi:exosome complex component CSL4
MKSQGEITFPGDLLGVIEEVSPGEGSYEEDGNVRSSTIGKVFYDMINRRSNVLSPKKSLMVTLRKAKYVYGIVNLIKEDVANVDIVSVEEKFITPISGLLHISQISNKRLNSILEAIRVGDVIKAKPLTFSPPISLTIKQKDLGVIFAQCSVCGHMMTKLDEEHLKCVYCGNVEQRKVGNYVVRKYAN